VGLLQDAGCCVPPALSAGRQLVAGYCCTRDWPVEHQ